MYGGAEGCFGVVDDCDQWQLIQILVQTQTQLRRAALAVGCRDDAFGGAEPSQYLGAMQSPTSKVIDELLLNQLSG
ncbi:hypothetical protein D3C87_1945960 [compost metagenome]